MASPQSLLFHSLASRSLTSHLAFSRFPAAAVPLPFPSPLPWLAWAWLTAEGNEGHAASASPQRDPRNGGKGVPHSCPQGPACSFFSREG